MAWTFKNRIEPFPQAEAEKIAKILGDTDKGLTGSEIGRVLQKLGIADPDPQMTKWQRIFNAFAAFQNEHKVGNHIVQFIVTAMAPAHYTDAPELFEDRKSSLNKVLALRGMEFRDDGRIHRCERANNLKEAIDRASRFKEKLNQRCVHEAIFAYCTPEILSENYFHSVFEAMKSIAAKVRSLSELSCDGAELVQSAFNLGKDCKPLLAINALDSETLRGEQRGFVNLLVGLFGVFRNPLAHEPKKDWQMDEQDALDIMCTISLVHRKLDKAYKFAP